MILDDYVKGLDADTIMHIGAKSGFFFIGDKVEYEDIIDQIDFEMKAGVRHTMIKNRSVLKKMIEQGEPNKPIEISYIKDGQPLTRGLSLEETKKRYYNRINSIKVLINDAKEYLNNYTKLRERNIIEFYGRVLNDDGIVLVVEGKEEGKYWYKSEYDSDACLDMED